MLDLQFQWRFAWPVLLAYGGSVPVDAGPILKAVAEVNNVSRASVDAGDVIDGTGLSLAVARAGPSPRGMQVFRVSDPFFEAMKGMEGRPANGVEQKLLTATAGSLLNLPQVKTADARNKVLAAALRHLDQQAKKNRVLTQIQKPENKGGTIKADTDIVKSRGGKNSHGEDILFEEAQGTATQTVKEAPDPNKNEKLKLDFSQIAKATTFLIENMVFNPPPAATAFAINVDPLAVQWAKPEFTLSLRDVTTDPSNPANLTLFAEASDGSAALAFYSFSVWFMNFDDPADIPTDLSTLNVDDASELFQFTALLFTDGDGGTPSPFFDLSIGGTSVDLPILTPDGPNSVTTLKNGLLSFTEDFSLTVTVPGDPKFGVLFTRDTSAAVTLDTVPEPSAVSLLCLGIAGLAGVGLRRRRGVKASMSKKKKTLPPVVARSPDRATPPDRRSPGPLRDGADPIAGQMVSGVTSCWATWRMAITCTVDSSIRNSTRCVCLRPLPK